MKILANAIAMRGRARGWNPNIQMDERPDPNTQFLQTAEPFRRDLHTLDARRKKKKQEMNSLKADDHDVSAATASTLAEISNERELNDVTETRTSGGVDESNGNNGRNAGINGRKAARSGEGEVLSEDLYLCNIFIYFAWINE